MIPWFKTLIYLTQKAKHSIFNTSISFTILFFRALFYKFNMWYNRFCQNHGQQYRRIPSSTKQLSFHGPHKPVRNLAHQCSAHEFWVGSMSHCNLFNEVVKCTAVVTTKCIWNLDKTLFIFLSNYCIDLVGIELWSWLSNIYL